jgi:membrane dipeptidase
MNEMGMIVDLAHASEQSILDVARATTAPILSSHSCAKGVYDTPRGLSDAAIKAIADTGGAIGIMFFPDVLAPRSDTDWDPVKEIQSIFTAVEADENLTPDEKAKRKLDAITKEFRRPSVVPDVEAVFQHIDYVTQLVGEDFVAIGSDYDGIPYSCVGLEHIGRIENLAHAMRRRGYPERRIQKIMGGNVLRILETVSGSA